MENTPERQRARNTIAHDVAENLGRLTHGWRYEAHTHDGDDHPWERLLINDQTDPVLDEYHGLTVSIGFDGWRNEGKIHASIVWPKDARGQVQAPYFSNYKTPGEPPDPATSINVAYSKSPRAIADDIARRLLTVPLLKLWLTMRARAQASDDYHDTSEATRRALCGPPLDGVLHYRRKSPHEDGQITSPHQAIGEVTVSRAHVDVKLHNLSLATARAVLSLVGSCEPATR